VQLILTISFYTYNGLVGLMVVAKNLTIFKKDFLADEKMQAYFVIENSLLIYPYTTLYDQLSVK